MTNSPSGAPDPNSVDPNAVDPNAAQGSDNNSPPDDPFAANEQNASTPPPAPEAEQAAPEDEDAKIHKWFLLEKCGMSEPVAEGLIMLSTENRKKPFSKRKFLNNYSIHAEMEESSGGNPLPDIKSVDIKREYDIAHPAPQTPAAPEQAQEMPISPDELDRFKWDLSSRMRSDDWGKLTKNESELLAFYKAYLATKLTDYPSLDDFLISKGIEVMPPTSFKYALTPRLSDDDKDKLVYNESEFRALHKAYMATNPTDDSNLDDFLISRGIEVMPPASFKYALIARLNDDDKDKLVYNESEFRALHKAYIATNPIDDSSLDDFLISRGIAVKPPGGNTHDPKPNAPATQPGAPATSSPNAAPSDPNAPAPKPTPEQFFQNFIYWFKSAVDPEIFKKFTDQDLRNLHVEYSNADPLKVRDMADFARIKGFTKPAPAAPESAEYDPTDLKQFIEDVSKLLYKQDSRQMGNDVFRDIQGLWIKEKPKDASGLRQFLMILKWKEGEFSRKLLLVPPGGSPKDPKPAVPEAENYPGNIKMHFSMFKENFEKAVGPEKIEKFTEQELRDLHEEYANMYREGKVRNIVDFAELKGYAKPALEKVEAEYDPTDLKQFKKDVRELLYEQDYKLLGNADFKDIQSWWIKDKPKDTSGLRKFLEGMSWDEGKRKLLLVPPGGSPKDPKPVVSDAENYPGNPPPRNNKFLYIAGLLGITAVSLGGAAYLVTKTDGCNPGKGESAAIPSAKASGSAKAPASATVAQPKKTAPVVVATPPVVPTVAPTATPTATPTVEPSVAPPVATATAAPIATPTATATATAAPTATPTAPKQPAGPSFWTTNKPSKIIVKCDNFVIPTNCELPPDCRQMRTFLSERVRIICEAANNRAVYETWQPGEGIYPHGKGVEIKLHLIEEE